jgi:hypothetical protein
MSHEEETKVLKEETKVLKEEAKVLEEEVKVLKEKLKVLKEKHKVLKEEKMVLEADLLKGGADFTIEDEDFLSEDEDFLEGLEESLLKHHPHGLDRLIELESRVSHDDEALYSVELRYAVSNWARHFKQSGARSVDYGEAHVFLKKYLLDWQLTLIHYGNISEKAGNTKYLIDCVPVSLPADVRAQILNAPRKTMLLYSMLSFGRILQNTRKQCGNRWAHCWASGTMRDSARRYGN